MAKPDFSKILRWIKPDLVIYDFLRPWPAEAASDLGIPAVIFVATSATMTSYMLHVFKYKGTEKYPFPKIFYRDYENAQVSESGGDCAELRKAIESLEISDDVILIKVGQEVNVIDKLPSGFHEKVGEKGMIVKGWAPQAKILSHPSIGGFVSHCGWNFVKESMYFGAPIIAAPMQLDQPINSRLIIDFGTGIEVLRDANGRLEREMMASVIKQVVAEKRGSFVKKNARDLGASIRKKGDADMDEVIKELLQIISVKKNKSETRR
ncbi:hypothetical protein AgCh_036189 [Apium graveolens]